MKGLILAGEVLPILGTISLLGLWLFEQNEMEKRSDELQKITNAHNSYQTYQSTNALFNAIRLGLKDEVSKQDIRIYQAYNYELGLYEMKKALYDSAQFPIQSSSSDVDQKMVEVQRDLEKVQASYMARRSFLETTLESDKRKYFQAFIFISVFSLAGSVCSALQKFTQNEQAGMRK